MGIHWYTVFSRIFLTYTIKMVIKLKKISNYCIYLWIDWNYPFWFVNCSLNIRICVEFEGLTLFRKRKEVWMLLNMIRVLKIVPLRNLRVIILMFDFKNSGWHLKTLYISGVDESSLNFNSLNHIIHTYLQFTKVHQNI